MTDLIKFEGIPPLEKKIMESTYAVQISQAPEAQLKDAVRSSVTNALYNLGQKMEDGERMILQSRIALDLRFHFQTLTIEEIKNAMDLGSKGEFRVKPDEVLYLSPEKIYSWFKAYKVGVKREASKKMAEISQKAEKAKEPTQEEKQKIVSDSILIRFEEFKKTGEVKDYGNVTYDSLDRMGLIPFTKERKREIYNEADRVLRASKIDDKDFLKRLREMHSEAQNLVKAEAKILALTIFFKDLVEMEVELKDLIEEKRK
jgi:hypothetical protein